MRDAIIRWAIPCACITKYALNDSSYKELSDVVLINVNVHVQKRRLTPI